MFIMFIFCCISEWWLFGCCVTVKGEMIAVAKSWEKSRGSCPSGTLPNTRTLIEIAEQCEFIGFRSPLSSSCRAMTDETGFTYHTHTLMKTSAVFHIYNNVKMGWKVKSLLLVLNDLLAKLPSYILVIIFSFFNKVFFAPNFLGILGSSQSKPLAILWRRKV